MNIARLSERISSRAATLSLVFFAIALSLTVQSPGWAQASYYALVKALSNGSTSIDQYQWETGDKSYIGGHFYSVKAPGLAFVSLPAYEALKAVGVQDLSDSAGGRLLKDQRPYSNRKLHIDQAGFSKSRALRIRAVAANDATMIWLLTLLGSLLPGLVVMYSLRRLAEDWAPGTGALSAICLGMGTIMLPYMGMFFGHVLSAAFVFGAFAILYRGKKRGFPARFLGTSGFLAGLSILAEYPTLLAVAVVGLYGLLVAKRNYYGVRELARRASFFGLGVVAGALPIIIYNYVSFGSVFTMTYENVVAVPGKTGHDVLGLVSSGLFGIGVPKVQGYASLLLSPRGLIALTPVTIFGAVGLFLANREGYKAEARLALAVFLVYWTYVAGYLWPMGGQVPGPRYLVPMLPFLAIGLPFAWKRFAAPVLAMAVASSVIMVTATVTAPMVKEQGVVIWQARVVRGDFLTTVFTLVGAGNGWLTILPSVLLFVAAWGFALVDGRHLDFRTSWRGAGAALLCWMLVALFVAPQVREIRDPNIVVVAGLPHRLIAVAALVAAAAVSVAALIFRSRTPQRP